VIEAGDADVQKGGEVVRKLGPGDGVWRDRPARDRHPHGIGRREFSDAAHPMFAREFKQLEAGVPGLVKSLRQTMAQRVAETSF
jgi:hypothetical protein